jgi:hypothetical protein
MTWILKKSWSRPCCTTSRSCSSFYGSRLPTGSCRRRWRSNCDRVCSSSSDFPDSFVISHATTAIWKRACSTCATPAIYGWFAPAITVDLANAQRLLHISAPEMWERVRRVVLVAAREWTHYGVRPSAAYFLLLPDSEADRIDGTGSVSA